MKQPQTPLPQYPMSCHSRPGMPHNILLQQALARQGSREEPTHEHQFQRHEVTHQIRLDPMRHCYLEMARYQLGWVRFLQFQGGEVTCPRTLELRRQRHLEMARRRQLGAMGSLQPQRCKFTSPQTWDSKGQTATRHQLETTCKRKSQSRRVANLRRQGRRPEMMSKHQL